MWGLRVQVAINIAAVAVAAGIGSSSCARPRRAAPPANWAARSTRRTRSSPAAWSTRFAARSTTPTPRLLFAHPRSGAWLGSDGRPVAPRADRSLSRVAPGSAIEHDPVLDDDPAVVESVAAGAAPALETERLRTLVRAHEAAPASAPGLDGVLTDREREVLGLAADGLTDTAIAQRLFLTRRTVETHLGHIFAKLDVPAGSAHNRRVHAVRRFLQARRQEP
jgi:DNA-binding CsgD family transcriptional regulator